MTDPTTPDEHPLVPDPGPAPDAVATRARTAALAAFDELHAVPAETGAASVTSIDAARRRGWRRPLPLGAAAAVLAVLVAVGVFGRLDTDPDEDFTATGAAMGEADQQSGGPESGGLEAGGGPESFDDDAADLPTDDADGSGEDLAGGGGAGPAAPTAPAARSTYPDLDALTDELASIYGDSARTNSGGSGGAAVDGAAPSTTSDLLGSCDPARAASVSVDDVVVLVPADVAGRSVVAVVYESGTGTRVAFVDIASCSLDDDRSL